MHAHTSKPEATPAQHPPEAPRGLLPRVVHDTRGAIFLLGIALGLVLIGVAWNVSSLGAAALWRERATDVADAAAFDAAVWHARGMNLLVMSNLLMAVFTALFTFWRMLVSVLAGLSYLCQWPLSSECAALPPLAEEAAVTDARVAENLVALQRSLVSTERVLASLTPVLPLVRTPAALLERYPEAAAIHTFSAALLASPDSAGSAPHPAASERLGREGAVQRELERRLGVGVSLPVEPDAPGALCARAADAQSWLERRSPPDDIERFGPAWRAMTGGDPGFFCRHDTFAPELREAVRAGLARTCAGSGEPAACVERRLARFRPTPLRPGPGPLATARLWAPFENGGPLASVWAVVELPRPLLDANDRGLSMPDAPGAGSSRPLAATGHVAAQAEYYFDCAGTWAECRDAAAWRLGHRARLRPLRPDLDAAAGELGPEWAAALRALVQRQGGDPWHRATAGARDPRAATASRRPPSP